MRVEEVVQGISFDSSTDYISKIDYILLLGFPTIDSPYLPSEVSLHESPLQISLLFAHAITGETAGELKAVADMHERKAEMARQADAFIAVPGGYGTLEELLEVITWAQLKIHHKPVMEKLVNEAENEPPELKCVWGPEIIDDLVLRGDVFLDNRLSLVSYLFLLVTYLFVLSS
ncbi:hypothetical protein L6452_10915 [Arctium lappa]|uniref:Uncharacterized protein n=1 Tax=Arctium lappa TaxID=4217 RepID=A0ACB9DN54_ARCLA|nr:hypothetical protein L6452_10915 [Arctium lappa]